MGCENKFSSNIFLFEHFQNAENWFGDKFDTNLVLFRWWDPTDMKKRSRREKQKLLTKSGIAFSRLADLCRQIQANLYSLCRGSTFSVLRPFCQNFTSTKPSRNKEVVVDVEVERSKYRKGRRSENGRRTD